MERVKHVEADNGGAMDVQRVEHGSIRPIEMEKLGVDPSAITDFSSNINPHGPSERVLQSLKRVNIAAYPDPDTLALRRVLAARLNAAVNQILVGNGSVELLWLIAMAYIQRHDQILIVGPAFGEYAHTARMMGGSVTDIDAVEANAFAVPFYEIRSVLHARRWKVVYLCNPNNPTGAEIPVDVILQWADESPDTLFVIDEAYIEFSTSLESMTETILPNTIVLRSLTKAYALAGLRIGYCVSTEKIVTDLRRICPPWNVNTMAQHAAVVALNDSGHLNRTLGLLREESRKLKSAIANAGFTIMPSTTHFFLVNVDDASGTRDFLLKQGIVVRDCTSFGLPSMIRIATLLPAQNELLVSALANI